ncbi:retrovirus-related pol polyprotein from transposon TNT 1-94, partial [Tanacetum coccineum]
GTGYMSNVTSLGGNNASGQERIVKCYNCQGEGHMARQCTQPKRPRNAAWYKENPMLAEAHVVLVVGYFLLDPTSID